MPWYTSSAAIEPSAIPVNVKSPACQVKSAMPMINGIAAVIWFSGFEKSTLLVSQMRTPRMPTNPYSTTVAPPSTPGGIAEITAPTLGQGQHDRHCGGNPIRGRRVHPGGGHHADVLCIGRRRRAAAEAGQRRRYPVGGDRAAHHRINLRIGHLAHRLDMPDVLGDKRADRGQEHR